MHISYQGVITCSDLKKTLWFTQIFRQILEVDIAAKKFANSCFSDEKNSKRFF